MRHTGQMERIAGNLGRRASVAVAVTGTFGPQELYVLRRWVRVVMLPWAEYLVPSREPVPRRRHRRR